MLFTYCAIAAIRLYIAVNLLIMRPILYFKGTLKIRGSRSGPLIKLSSLRWKQSMVAVLYKTVNQLVLWNKAIVNSSKSRRKVTPMVCQMIQIRVVHKISPTRTDSLIFVPKIPGDTNGIKNY